MAPTETAKPNQPESSNADGKPDTAQNPPTDPSTTEHLQQTVSGSSKLTDPATEEILRETTKPSSMKQTLAIGYSNIPIEIFQPEDYEPEGSSKASGK